MPLAQCQACDFHHHLGCTLLLYHMYHKHDIQVGTINMYLLRLQPAMAASWGPEVSPVGLALHEGASWVFQGHATSPHGDLGAGHNGHRIGTSGYSNVHHNYSPKSRPITCTVDLEQAMVSYGGGGGGRGGETHWDPPPPPPPPPPNLKGVMS